MIPTKEHRAEIRRGIDQNGSEDTFGGDLGEELALQLLDAIDELERQRDELKAAAVAVLDHVEDQDAERVLNQCTLCYSYRSLLRKAAAATESENAQ